MAKITDAKLGIQIDTATKIATCVVTGKISFTPYELNEMKEGLKFRLDCQLWGDDPIADDYLFSYPAKSFPDRTPNAVESVSFSAKLHQSQLNEDIGEDEIYGKLILLNTYTQIKVAKKTNVIHFNF